MSLKQICLFFLFIFFFSFQSFSEGKKNILILNSYHEGLSWTDSITHGICHEFEKQNDSIELYIEYIDNKRFFDDTYYTSIYNFLKVKYTTKKFDLIFSSDDYSLEFLFQYRDSLFGKVPVVFCGINNLNVHLPEDYVGVFEKIDFLGNVKLIEKLHPDYSKIYFIVDKTKTGNIVYNSSLIELKEYIDKNKIEYLRDFTFDQLRSKIISLEKDAVVLFTPFTKDNSNSYINYENVIQKVCSESKVPIYGVWNFYLGNGIIGGKMNNGYQQGNMASKIALQILSGEKIENIKTQIASSYFAFDYKKMKEFGIRKSDLPKKSKILNCPLSFITENKSQFFFFSIIFVMLIAIIIVLWIFLLFRRNKMISEKRYKIKLELSNEKLKLAKEKAEDANRLKSAFLANVSHELRTPMNGVVGFSKILIDSPDLDIETRLKYLNIVNRSGYSLLNLINDIIDLSKIEANQLRINYSNCKLNELMDELFNFYISEKTALEKNNIQLFVSKELENQDFFIYSDSNRIRQVFYNLINNALKFTKEGTIEFGYKIQQQEIIFFVKDTGIGLTKFEQEIIFERFRQTDDASTRKYGGSGLGLSISKGIVENLKGKIWVESERNIGSTFFFSIPFISVKNGKEDGVKLKDKNKDFNWQTKTILIVEDVKVSFDLLTKFMAETKVNILHAADGDIAVKLCIENNSIDLVLMDIQLPTIDGLEATSIIKKSKPNLPIIAQTANAMADDRRTIIEAGCDDYIAKPINKSELLDKIDSQFKRT